MTTCACCGDENGPFGTSMGQFVCEDCPSCLVDLLVLAHTAPVPGIAANPKGVNEGVQGRTCSDHEVTRSALDAAESARRIARSGDGSPHHQSTTRQETR